ncbi:MAG: chemotaxis protein MotA [Gemmatales bacterium]|nr:MAG: chemotaxis protein MotA [Gemmatales bacterium]
MDVATLIGLFAGSVLILVSIMMGGNMLDFINVPSLMITVGGCFSALLINFPLRSVIGMLGVVKQCFFYKLPDSKEEIKRLADLATTARRDGLLALEKKLADIKDPFLLRGLEMVIDGAPKEKIDEVLNIELEGIEERHSSGKKILDQMASLAPAFGMIGTLIGLIQMLRTMDDPSQIGIGMATAMLTTFYGSLIANLFCIPMAGKLELRNKEEVQLRTLMICGILAIVEGEAPRAVETKLKVFLHPRQRDVAA